MQAFFTKFFSFKEFRQEPAFFASFNCYSVVLNDLIVRYRARSEGNWRLVTWFAYLNLMDFTGFRHVAGSGRFLTRWPKATRRFADAGGYQSDSWRCWCCWTFCGC